MLRKIYENILTYRLNWWLKNHKKQTEISLKTKQINYRCLINRKLNGKKYALAPCLHLEKAFDLANHKAIIIQAANLGKPLGCTDNFFKKQDIYILGLEFDAPKLKWKSHLDKIKTLTQEMIDIIIIIKTNHIFVDGKEGNTAKNNIVYCIVAQYMELNE